MAEQIDFARRRFIVASAATGGGLALGFSALALGAEAKAGADALTDNAAASSEFSPWLIITPDNSVTVRVPTPECGNGARTQIAMTIAEELQCDWTKVRLEYASTGRDYAEQRVYSKLVGPSTFFGGRSTTPEWNQLLLQVGASARERLKLAAAHTWRVPVAEVDAKNSLLTHRPTARTLSYGAVAERAASIKLAVEPTLKPQGEWSFLGKASPSKLHLPQVVNGSAQFGMDVRLPGMLYAALLQSPVQDGKLRHVDFEAIRHMPGVRGIAVIEGGDPAQKMPAAFPLPREMGGPRTSAVAVVADHYWQAKKALDALPVEWDDGAGAQWKSTEQIFDAARALTEREGGLVLKSSGDVPAALAKSTRVVEASYTTPYCDHVTMEPLNGTALCTTERLELWHPTQPTLMAHAAAAEESGLPVEQVVVHQTLVGGGFGRRIQCDDVRMVVAVAKQFPGVPIHTIWSREESMRQGRYRALMAVKLKAGLGADGLPEALFARAAGRGQEGGPYTNLSVFSIAAALYDGSYAGIVPNVHVESQSLPIHIRSGAYRGPGYNSTAFVVESFIDECAHAAGIDPLDYRLRLHAQLPDPGWALCLKEAARQAGWGRKLKRGMAQGIAISNYYMMGKPKTGTTVAVVATIEVSKNGALKVHALDVAFDCGRLMNADAVRTQMMGGVVYGLNMSLNEMLTVKNGRIVEGNYDQYPMLRMADMPKINIHFGGLSGDDRYSEVGEAPVGPVGPAIANAIFRITGKRIRSTPFRLHDLSWT